MGEPLLTVPELAARLKVGRSTTYEIIAAGLIDVTPVGTGKRPRIRISERALAKYLARRKQEGRAT